MYHHISPQETLGSKYKLCLLVTVFCNVQLGRYVPTFLSYLTRFHSALVVYQTVEGLHITVRTASLTVHTYTHTHVILKVALLDMPALPEHTSLLITIPANISYS
jgi:hypothetical protein